MRICIAAALLLCSTVCSAQLLLPTRHQPPVAYPESEAVAAWQALAASYVRKALKDRTLDNDPLLNARVDAVMAGVGAAVAALDPRFAKTAWRAILIEDFGHGAAAFAGATVLVDAKFVRSLDLTNDELALVFSHEVAHVLAGHGLEKLAFMATIIGKDRAPTARTALLEFFAKDSYAAVFHPTARLQEREADAIGAAILLESGYDTQRALGLFDKLAQLEARDERRRPDTHDPAAIRKLAVAAAVAQWRQLRALAEH